ncbi:TOMM precursor leader peptide-binding protein [Streptomonospora arabica]|uniref:TOMM leader peptide-binding protein n=1 Tax=Streptomonospora arabica TaxID=412417 RepID=A0ABV9SPJ2_9ACTN
MTGETTAAPAGAVAGGGGAALHVVGSGLLADAIADAAAAHGGVAGSAAPEPEAAGVDTGALVVAAADGWDTRPYPRVRAACDAAPAPWLPVRTELGRLVLGPVELPGRPGCGDCADLRRRVARRDPRGREEVLRVHGDALAERPSSWLTTLAADLAAALVLDEAQRVAQDPESARTRNAMIFVELDSLRTSRHRFLPNPLCERCGSRPDDAAALAELSLASRPKPTPDTYRAQDVADRWESLEQTYFDPECGLVHTLTKGSGGGVVTASAELGAHGDSVEYGFGWTRSYRTSRVVALLEALERYGATHPGGRRTAVHAPYADVRDEALDPRELGLYPPERHVAGFSFRPFSESVACSWVWGYSFARSAPILVPENYVYYRLMRRAGPENPPFVYECSNGCALGGSVEEAAFYGALEVAERDAFLMTWYARMPVPRIDIGSARDDSLPLLATAIERETGYEVRAFDTTLEYGVPSVWTMAVRPGDDDAAPKAACSGGAHLDPERALQRALSELGPMTAGLLGQDPARQARAREMVRDPSLVTLMAHHTQLYGHPEAFDRFDFLDRCPGLRRVADMARVPPAADLRDDLAELVRRYLDCGLDVIVVDQTTPEHRAGGLACVKVIVPGTLPMTFGHAYRRVHGLPRLYTVPHRLGYADRPLGPEDISHHPHPFP